MPDFWRVEPIWAGETAVCVAGGPSLTPEQVDLCRGKARVIAINDAYRLAPWADLLYACDLKWWRWHEGVPGFIGTKATQDQRVPVLWPEVRCLESTVNPATKLDDGFDERPWCIRTGRNSGYQAIHLAAHLGARRILLLGFDMKPGADGKMHWFGQHPTPTPPSDFRVMLPRFASLAQPLSERGIEVANCSPGSALTVWPQKSLAGAL